MKIASLPSAAVAAAALILLGSCAAPSGPVTTAVTPTASRSATNESFHTAATERPGLGTKWGETRNSRVHAVPFERASAKAFARAAIYYNDLSGILAMGGSVSPQRTWPVLPGPMSDLVQVGLRDKNGRSLAGLIVGDHWFVVGEKGQRYSIFIRNRSDLRLEVVLSVDGLDVMDGRAASLRKRGYIIPPHGEISVQGFRHSLDEVAAFRFSSVRESYANQKYGETRNVGVVGIALFHERGANPWTNEESRRRLRANPFPGGGFATPP